jgi:sulfur carrier protein ThiS
MISVKLYDLLQERSLSGKDHYEVPYQEGMTPLDLIRREGFTSEEAQSILAIVNDEQRSKDEPLKDGDRVELVMAMVGGAA